MLVIVGIPFSGRLRRQAINLDQQTGIAWIGDRPWDQMVSNSSSRIGTMKDGPREQNFPENDVAIAVMKKRVVPLVVYFTSVGCRFFLISGFVAENWFYLKALVILASVVVSVEINWMHYILLPSLEMKLASRIQILDKAVCLSFRADALVKKHKPIFSLPNYGWNAIR